MLDYSALSALAAVIREGSFERAAFALHVTPSAVSQRIKLLEERLGAESLPAAQAEIVAAAFENGARKGVLEDFTNQRDVVIHQLLLEGARAGGDDRLSVGEDRGDEIGERLADPGGCLGDQHAWGFERLRPRERHPELSRPRLEPRHRRCDRTAGGERHPHFPQEISGHAR